MLNKIKDDIYIFFKNQMAVKYPDVFGLDENGFSNKIYWYISKIGSFVIKLEKILSQKS